MRREGGLVHQQKKSWFDRNWQWMLGCGCLVVVLGGGAVGGAVFFGAQKLSKFMPTDQAMAYVEADPEVIEALGSPVKASMVNRRFNMNMSGGKQVMEMEFRVSGPNGDAQVKATATRGNNEEAWVFLTCEVEPHSSIESIDCMP